MSQHNAVPKRAKRNRTTIYLVCDVVASRGIDRPASSALCMSLLDRLHRFGARQFHSAGNAPRGFAVRVRISEIGKHSARADLAAGRYTANGFRSSKSRTLMISVTDARFGIRSANVLALPILQMVEEIQKR